MTRRQFRTLYRQFLFRMVDLELLAPQGDMTRLLGQFAGLLVFFSACLAFGAILSDGLRMPPQTRLIATWSLENFLIATTMLVVGLFAVLSWDSTFPDRRDVLVLAPLPVRARTLFFAKVAVVGSALGLTILSLHCLAGLVWPLMLARQVVAISAPSVEYEPAIPPVSLADLKPVLDHDLAPALRSGTLAPATGAGLVIGVIQHGDRRVYAYGIAHPDSIYEIGSVSKTFTGLLLAKMVIDGRLRLDEPVRELLPPGTVAKPKIPEITLLDLATHHSGLPGMPNNLNGDTAADIFANYHIEDLYAYLRKRGLWRPEEPGFLYSNLGFGLLGQGLADRAGTSYANLLQREITVPLKLRDTTTTPTPEQQRREIQAFDANNKPVPAWDLDALAPAGAIRSTADDLLTYLEANLHPESASSLKDALIASHVLHADIAAGLEIALAWIYHEDDGFYDHGGIISGYTTVAFFDPHRDLAGAVLLNNAMRGIPFSEVLAQHIRERMEGRPAISLASITIPPGGGFFGILRSLLAYWITMTMAGAFIFCCVLAMQGLAAQLPRRIFLRVSSLLQMIAFAAVLCTYLMQPLEVAPTALSPRQLATLPSYWFLGVFDQLNGSPALDPLARRAWVAFAIAFTGMAIAYALSYFRTMRKIVEEPDIVSATRHTALPLPFGGSLATAIVRFSYRTLSRSRQHRVILAFYSGVGAAILVFIVKHPGPREAAREFPLLFLTVVAMCVWIAGVRVVFSLPLALRANWIFRVTEVRPASDYLAAIRRALFILGLAPVWIASAVVLFTRWPWRTASEHLIVLALWGTFLACTFLHGFQKIPFTCSYLPGKTYVHMAVLTFLGLLFAISEGVRYELGALHHPAQYATLVAILAIAAILARWRTVAHAQAEQAIVQFEDSERPAVLELGLHRDGVVP